MRARIGIIGTCCTGKSTTIEAIAKKSGLVYIKEDARDLYEQLQREPGYDREDPQGQLRLQYKIHNAKWANESQAFESSFIADRTYLDNFMYFLYYCHRITDRDLCVKFENICKAAMEMYTHLFILELDSIPYKQDEIRIETYGGALFYETSMFGIIQRWRLAEKVKKIPYSKLEDRVNFILGRVQ